MQQQDVERILRDVLNADGLRVSAMRTEPTLSGWRVMLADAAGRVISIDLPDGSPATVRSVLTHWVENG